MAYSRAKMDPLSITASLIAVLQISGSVTSTLYEYRAGVKSASGDAARIISELNGLRGVLEGLLQAVEKEDASSGGGSRLATFQALAQPNGELELCKTDLEAVSVKLGGDGLASSSGWKRVRRALEWPFKEKDVEKLWGSVQRAKTTMHLALATDQVSLALEIHEVVGNLTQQFAASSLDQRCRRVKGWLAAPDPFPNHATARKKWQPLTGEWFLRSELYESWMSTPRSFLWLYGIRKLLACSFKSSLVLNILSWRWQVDPMVRNPLLKHLMDCVSTLKAVLLSLRTFCIVRKIRLL
jgi:ankyrin repeat domain-containing protein 50